MTREKKREDGKRRDEKTRKRGRRREERERRKKWDCMEGVQRQAEESKLN